jgi:hypothetical protein
MNKKESKIAKVRDAALARALHPTQTSQTIEGEEEKET